MAYVYTELDTGELYVENVDKDIKQYIPAIPRPYNLIYIPTKNEVIGVKNLSDVIYDFQHLKVVK